MTQALCSEISQEKSHNLDEEISLPELHVPSFGAYSLVWIQNIAHWKPGGCNSSLCFPNFIKTHKFSDGLARASK
jgi:hypothetical protein